jgi:cation:H+ antiporter
MPPVLAVPVFLASLAVTLVAARLFARRLDRLGVRFGFPEVVIGLLTALAADGPEISSALFALIKGAHEVSIGVLVGSNAFNLAAMIGVSGLLAGSVLLPRQALLVDGLIGAAITLIAAAVLLRWISPLAAATVAGCTLLVYLVILIEGAQLVLHPRRAGRYESQLVGAVGAGLGPRRLRPSSSDPARHLFPLIVLDVALIIAGSAGMVEAALALGGSWHVSRAVMGVLILAPLTSLPNAITGVRLGLAGRAAALVSETFNSNTINLALGVIVPALFATLAVLTTTAKLELSWLVVMTLVSLLLLGRRRGIRRPEAAALIGLYLGFAALQIGSH